MTPPAEMPGQTGVTPTRQRIICLHSTGGLGCCCTSGTEISVHLNRVYFAVILQSHPALEGSAKSDSAGMISSRTDRGESPRAPQGLTIVDIVSPTEYPDALVASGIDQAVPGLMRQPIVSGLREEDVDALVDFFLEQK